MMDMGTHDPIRNPRLRTAYDHRAMNGEVPFVVGGNPTPEEAKRQREADATFTVHPPDHALEYERRGMFCHTCGKWIEWPKPESYGVMPGNLGARGDAGWLDDGDRDSTQAAKLAELVKDMDATCAEILAREVSSGQLELRAVARRWQAIRKITQGNQTNEGKQ